MRRTLLAMLCTGAFGDREHTCVRQVLGQEAVFECGGKLITQVEFASFGTPKGTCNTASGIVSGAEQVAACHASTSTTVLEDKCLGQSTCMFPITAEFFQAKSCPGNPGGLWMMAQLRCGGDETKQPVQIASRSGIGIGWQAVIIILSLFALYFALGVAYKVRREGAKLNSLEAVPHVEMWKELPYLVCDGIIFSIDTIKSKVSLMALA